MEDRGSESITKSRAGIVAGNILSRFGTFLILLIMIITLSLLTPNFLTMNNILNILRQISIIAITALGMTMVIVSGGIDLSVGSTIGVVTLLIGVFAHPPNVLVEFLDGIDRLVNYPQVHTFPLIVPILAGIVIGGLIGLVNGAIIAYGKIPPFVATLGMLSIARGIAFLESNNTPVQNFTTAFLFIGRGSLFGIPFPVLMLFVLVLLSHYIMSKTSFGRHVYAIGGNISAARAAGINIKRRIMMIYCFSGIMAAIGAIILASRNTSAQLEDGTGMEFDAITAAVIGGASLMGGVGTIPGTLIGAIIVGVLKNGLVLLSVSAYWQKVLTGVIIIGTVMLDAKRNAERAKGLA